MSEIRSEKALAKIRAMDVERQELEKLIPLHRNKHRLPRRVKKSELWTKDQAREMSKLADEFLKEKRDGQEI